MDRNEMNDGGVLTALSADWALMAFICTLWDSTRVIASAGLDMAKGFGRLNTDVVTLTYEKFNAGVAKAGSLFAGWRPKERRGFALLVVMTVTRLQETKQKLDYDIDDATKQILTAFRDGAGSVKALREKCAELYEAVDALEVKKGTFGFMGLSSEVGPRFERLNALGPQVKKAAKGSDYNLTNLVGSGDFVDEVIKADDLPVTSFGGGTWVTDEDIQAAVAESEAALGFDLPALD